MKLPAEVLLATVRKRCGETGAGPPKKPRRAVAKRPVLPRPTSAIVGPASAGEPTEESRGESSPEPTEGGQQKRTEGLAPPEEPGRESSLAASVEESCPGQPGEQDSAEEIAEGRGREVEAKAGPGRATDSPPRPPGAPTVDPRRTPGATGAPAAMDRPTMIRLLESICPPGYCKRLRDEPLSKFFEVNCTALYQLVAGMIASHDMLGASFQATSSLRRWLAASESSREGAIKALQEAEGHLQAAESASRDWEDQFLAAERWAEEEYGRARLAEGKLAEAMSRLLPAEQRAEETARRLADVEERLEAAEAEARDARERAALTESDARGAELRKTDAEGLLKAAEAEASAAQERVALVKDGAREAEARKADAEARAGSVVDLYKSSPDFKQEVAEASADAYLQGFAHCKEQVAKAFGLDGLDAIVPGGPDGGTLEEEEEENSNGESEPGPESDRS